MDERQRHGFQEIPHTADWALNVWAEDLAGLLVTALQGMYALLQIKVGEAASVEIPLSLSAPDAESLLVSFLSEILYLGETHNAAYEVIDLHLEDLALEARLAGRPILAQRKEIKAVTYHRLAIQSTPKGLETTIVFDV